MRPKLASPLGFQPGLPGCDLESETMNKLEARSAPATPSWHAEESLQLDYFDVVRDRRAVVMPADNTVAFLWVVAMYLEVARLKFKFDSDSFLAVTDLPIGNAVRVSCADCFDSEL